MTNQSEPRNPMQPFVRDKNGVVRFKPNKIVQKLLAVARKAGYDLNSLAGEYAQGVYSQDDYERFSQLHGCTLRDFHKLSGVSDDVALQATQNARIQFKNSDISGCRDHNCDLHCGVEKE